MPPTPHQPGPGNALPAAGASSSDKQALLALRRMRARIDELERATTEPIAVIGLGCRFPGGASSPAAFWSLLRNGVNAVSEVPPDRWDIDAFYDPDPDAPGKMYARHGGFVAGVDLFDASHFGMTPKEAASMDPQHRLLLEVAWEALEHAGCAPDGLAGSDAGVFVGISLNDYGQIVLKAAEQEGFNGYVGTGNLLSAAAGRLSYVLGLHGPSLAVDTACSSSLVATHLACQSLRNRECNLAIVGGVNLMLSPRVTVNCCRARMLAADGRCKTFDARGDGYVRGEGCGVVILKRLSSAVANGDRILAVLPGSAVNQDGRSSGFTAPNELAQQMVIRKALAAARVAAADVGYVEAHGTGTSLGDPIEVQAIAAAYGEKRRPDQPMIVGSIKTNIGHLESAAGIAGLIKVILALQHQEISPHLHFTALNPHISLDGFPLVIPVERMEWPVCATPRLAGVSSFGLSGTNAHVIVQEAPPERPQPASIERPTHLLALSARNAAALGEVARRYAAHLAAAPDALADVAFTANAGRVHFDERLAIVGSSVEEVRAALSEVASTGSSPRVRRGRVPKSGAPDVAFLFTGQGAQYAGMGRELYATQPTFRRTLDRCDEILRSELERPLLTVLHPAGGDESTLNETQYTQPALFALGYALAELWRSWGITPAAVLGHSVGEYVAACVAGVLTLEDALRLVAARGRLMQRLSAPGAMVAVSADAARVGRALQGCQHEVAIAAINGPANTVISGAAVAVARVSAALEAAGVKTRRLTVSHAFHSPLLEPMLDEFERIAATITPAPPQLTFASNVTGTCVGPAFAFDARYWRRHAREPVRFAEGVAALHAQGARVFVEIGPHPTLSAMAAQAVPAEDATWLPSLRQNGDEWHTMLDTAARLYTAGADIDWAGFDRDYLRRRVSLPTYPFQRERHWVDVAAPAPAAAPVGVASAMLPLYAPRWSAVPRPQAAGEEHSRSPQHWLLLAGDGLTGAASLSVAIQQAFERAGDRCTLVAPATAARPVAARQLDFEDPAGYRDLVTTITADGRKCHGVIVVAPHAPQQVMTDEDLHAGQALCRWLLHTVQALSCLSAAVEPPRIWIVTRGAQPAGGRAPLSVAQSTVWGLGRVVALEHPEMWGGLIDAGDDDLVALPQLVADMRAPVGEDQVAYRHGVRHVARLTPVTAPDSSRRRLSGAGTYVIAGGLGSLGLLLAARLVSRGARHLALVGRTALPPREQWPLISETTRIGAQIAAVRALENAGASVHIHAADIACKEQVDRLFDDLGQHCPPIRGIVHAAGVSMPSPVADLTPAMLAAICDPKVAGAWRLHQAAGDRPLDFFVMFSSIASVWGSKGLGGYAAANHFLDALASHRRALGLAGLSINWGPWADGAMVDGQGRAWLAQMGIRALDSDRALDAFERSLDSPEPQLVVADVDWSTFLPVFGARARRPMFEQLAAATGSGPTTPDAAPQGPRLRERLAGMLPGQRREEIVRVVRQHVADVIGMAKPGQIEVEAGLFQMGMDSLMAVQLRHRLEKQFDLVLSPTLTFDYPSISELAVFLECELFGAGAVPAQPAAVAGATETAPVDLLAAVSALESMSDEQVERLLAGGGGRGAR